MYGVAPCFKEAPNARSRYACQAVVGHSIDPIVEVSIETRLKPALVSVLNFGSKTLLKSELFLDPHMHNS
jgi:hypothetical protein